MKQTRKQKVYPALLKLFDSFWKEGYKDAFEGYLGLSFKDIELKNIVLLWADSYWNEDKTKCFIRQKSQRKTTKVNIF